MLPCIQKQFTVLGIILVATVLFESFDPFSLLFLVVEGAFISNTAH